MNIRRYEEKDLDAVFERVDKVDTFKEKTRYTRILFENKGFRSHGASSQQTLLVPLF